MKLLLLFALTLFSINVYPFYSQLRVKHTEGKGIGFNQGYSSLDYLGMGNWSRVETLINVRGHIFNGGDWAGNGGLGARYQTSECSLLGLYGFYDFREDHHLFFQQASVGTEFLTKWIDFRLNGYLPFGKNTTSEHRIFNRFTGNTIEVVKKFKGAVPMLEFEVGCPIRFEKIYFSAGPYYLFHSAKDGNLTKAGWGGKVHLNVNIGDYFSFGGGVTYDEVFDFGGTGFASINIPFGGKPNKMRLKCNRSMREIPIMRNEIIPVEKKTSIVPLSEEQDESGGALTIVFVNNTAPFGGDGSFETPFNSLADAEANSSPGDIIYVFPGDHTSRNMDTGITLQENQILVSSGHDFSADGVNIPALTPGDLPVISNSNPDEPIVQNPSPNQGLLSDFFTLFNKIVGP